MNKLASLFKFIFLFLSFLGYSSLINAQLKPSLIISRGMVIQRSQPIPLWGAATAGSNVIAELDGAIDTALTNSSGQWEMKLPAMEAGGPYQLILKSGTQKITYADVYVGDVWLASGQSNMAMSLSQCSTGAAEISSANNQKIRQFMVVNSLGDEPVDKLPAGSAWTPATSGSVGNFTALGYYFAKYLYADLNIPIGIINTSYGGSRIEAWMSKEMLGYDEKDVFLANGERERQPTTAYNTMIQPLLRVPVKGFIWYQGESNADILDDAMVYSNQFKKMITSWRELWGLGDLPFLWIQLPNYGIVANENSPGINDAWPQLRNGQSRALSLPNTGEATTIDLGEVDIHPKNKITVGERLAIVARKVAYNEDIVASGPRYESHRILSDGKVEISFDHIGGGLVAKNSTSNALKWFSIAGSNGKLLSAKAVIEGDKVIVWNTTILDPVTIRYAWEFNPVGVNFYNKEGLPAVPFMIKVKNSGFKIESFKANTTSIDRGQSVIFSWRTSGVKEVLFDGMPVDSVDAILVWPKVDGSFTLKTISNSTPEMQDSVSISIKVGEPLPTIKLSSASGSLLALNAEVVVQAAAAAPGGGTVTEVQFFQDGKLIFTDNQAPYEINWYGASNGNYSLTAQVTNDKGLKQTSAALVMTVTSVKLLTFEAENAPFTGKGTIVNSTAANKGKYVDLTEGWKLNFDGIEVAKAGTYQLYIFFKLNYQSPKTQNLWINGILFSPMIFEAASTTTWNKYAISIPLKAGVNQISIESSWGWMSFDYIAIPVEDPTAIAPDLNGIGELNLEQNMPNPFHTSTSIAFTIPEKGQTELEVLDLSGRKVSTLISKNLEAGKHSIQFESNDVLEGFYLLKLKFNNSVITKKILISK